MSSCKSLHNEIEFIETIRNSKKVEASNYYIVKISNLMIDDETLKELTMWLITRKDNQPLVSYHTSNSQGEKIIYILFTSADDGQSHFLDGTYSKLISYYLCTITKWLLSREGESFDPDFLTFEADIIEFESHIEIFTFFSVKVYDNHNNLIESLGVKDVHNKTQKEIDDIIKRKSVDLAKISDERKFGVFTKLKRKGGRVVIERMSEYLNSRDNKKYIDFLFQE